MKNWLKVERAIHNVSQEEVAKSLNISRQTITAIETRDYSPSITLALKISKLFNRSVEEMFELDDEELKSIPVMPVIKRR